MGGGKQTVGYHYMFDILFGLGRGPINELREIKVADKRAYPGGKKAGSQPTPILDSTVYGIGVPNLFGGDEKEGGIQGPFRVFFGDEDQVLPGAGSANCGSNGPLSGTQPLPAVKSAIGGLVSEMRGTSMVWFSGLVTSMSPYPKPWAFRIGRWTAGWHGGAAWYPEKALVRMGPEGTIHAMNPAHMIYQCSTDPVWGRGLLPSQINEESFIYAANKLCAEAFGMCLSWNRKEDISQFINQIQEHIKSVIYTDPETGKLTIRLIRNDYDPDGLPLFTKTTGLLDITDDDSSGQDEIINEVLGKGRDPITNEDFQVRVQNLAARQSMGSFNSESKQYPGIPTRELMSRVIMGDLRMHAAGLKRLTVVLDRRGWKIRPGACIRISDDRRGIGNIILRVLEISDQSFRDGKITLKTVQDVYGVPETSYVDTGGSTWEPPSQLPVAPLEPTLLEANYRDIVVRGGTVLAGALDATDAIIGTVAASPDSVMYEYVLASRAVGEADFRQTTGSFTGLGTLVADIGPYDTEFEISGEINFTDAVVGQAILVDDEQMGLTAYDAVTHICTVERGVADTIPAAHLAGVNVWTVDDDFVMDTNPYAAGETAEAYVLTKTFSEVLDPAETDLLTLLLTGRQGRPYPPGNVLVDGEPALELPDPYLARPTPTLTWAHRDRLIQEDQLIGHTEASVGPEAGVTYTIRVFAASDPLVAIRTVTDIADTSWQYDGTMHGDDGSPPTVWFELESVRDGLASHNLYRFKVVLESGYGLGYGYNYGGVV